MKSLKSYTPVDMKTPGSRVRVSLNIPKSLKGIIDAELRERNMSMAEFFHFLMARYGKLLSSEDYRLFLPSSMGIFTRYQKRGQNLKQKTVKVAPEDWVYAEGIATAIHASRSLIFIHCVCLLVYGASDLLSTTRLKRAYFRALAKKGRMVRLEACVRVDLGGMVVHREHRWEYEKTPENLDFLVGKT